MAWAELYSDIEPSSGYVKLHVILQ